MLACSAGLSVALSGSVCFVAFHSLIRALSLSLSLPPSSLFHRAPVCVYVCVCVMFIFWIYVCIAFFNPICVCNECMDDDGDDGDGDTHSSGIVHNGRQTMCTTSRARCENMCIHVCARIVDV